MIGKKVSILTELHDHSDINKITVIRIWVFWTMLKALTTIIKKIKL